jgi:hypothetical protein
VHKVWDFLGQTETTLVPLVCDQLEVEGCVLAEQLAEHMLMCFQSWDPTISLDPVMLGPVVGTEEVASSGV